MTYEISHQATGVDEHGREVTAAALTFDGELIAVLAHDYTHGSGHAAAGVTVGSCDSKSWRFGSVASRSATTYATEPTAEEAVTDALVYAGASPIGGGA